MTDNETAPSRPRGHAMTPETDPLVGRLRAKAGLREGYGYSPDLLVDAADTIERLTAHIEREDRAHDNTIGQRDSAEEALSRAYQLVVGDPPQWSNMFGYQDALDVMEATLRVQLAAREDVRGGLEHIMRALHAMDCQVSDEERARDRLPPVDKWADPWDEQNRRYRLALEYRATLFMRALPPDPTPAASERKAAVVSGRVVVVEDQEYPGDWRVETFDAEGSCYIAIFCGPLAEDRARQYAKTLSAPGTGTGVEQAKALEEVVIRQARRVVAAWQAGAIEAADDGKFIPDSDRALASLCDALFVLDAALASPGPAAEGG